MYRHVVWLTLDHMRVEAICLVRDQLILWNLLNPHDHFTLGHVCRHFCTQIFEIFDGEAPSFGGLDQKGTPTILQHILQISRNKGAPTLMLTFALVPQTNGLDT